MTMDAHQFNILMIPHDIADPKLRHGVGYDDKGREKAVYKAAFACDVVIAPKPKTTLAQATHPSSSTAMSPTSGNQPSQAQTAGAPLAKQDYQEEYMQKKAQKEQEEKKRQAAEKKEEEKRQKEIAENNTRQRARYLQEQLDFWKSAAAKASHDEQTIMANIDALERELNSIDSKFWVR
ncbi:MAG: hypothetical protein AB7E52_04125 [Bdellovibrionales bacterium]